MRQVQSEVVSNLSQKLLDTILRTPADKISNRVKLQLLMQCRSIIARSGDPLVRYNLDGVEIALPLSHDLPLNRKAFPDYSSNIARITKYVKAKYPDLTFVDIGANVGDTMVLVHNAANLPILCVEGDSKFFSILKMNATRYKTDVYIEKTFVGSVTGEIKGSVDSQRGTARLVEDATSSETLHLERLADIFKSQPLFAKSKMIKVDTDGFDTRILRSELELLSDLKPVLFFEYDPYSFRKYSDEGFKVYGDLRSIGYTNAMFYDNTGDYLLTTDLSNEPLIQDIHEFYSGRGGLSYCDVCAFHAVDSDICRKARFAEIEYFKRRRRDVT